ESRGEPLHEGGLACAEGADERDREPAPAQGAAERARGGPGLLRAPGSPTQGGEGSARGGPRGAGPPPQREARPRARSPAGRGGAATGPPERPGQAAGGAAPSAASCPGASRPATMPRRTSPVPPLASAGPPVGFTTQAPSGPATTVAAPFSTTTAPLAAASR